MNRVLRFLWTMLFFQISNSTNPNANDLSGVSTEASDLNISKFPGTNYNVTFVFANGNSEFVNPAGADNVCPGACQKARGINYEWYKPSLQDYSNKYYLCPSVASGQPFIYAKQPVRCAPGIIGNGWGYDSSRKLSFCMCMPKLKAGELRGVYNVMHRAGGTREHQHVMTSMDSYFTNERGAQNICEKACAQQYGEKYTWDNEVYIHASYTLHLHGVDTAIRDGWGSNPEYRVSFCRCTKKSSIVSPKILGSSFFYLYTDYNFRQANQNLGAYINVNSDSVARQLCPIACQKENALWDSGDGNESIKVLGASFADAAKLKSSPWLDGPIGMTRCDAFGMAKISGGKGWARSSFCNCHKQENGKTIFNKVYADILNQVDAREKCPGVCSSSGLIVNQSCADVCNKDNPVTMELENSECRKWTGGGHWDFNDGNDDYAVVDATKKTPYHVIFNRNLTTQGINSNLQQMVKGWGARAFCNCYYPNVAQFTINDEFDPLDLESPSSYCITECENRGMKLAAKHKIIHPTAPNGTQGYYLARTGASTASSLVCACIPAS